MPLLPTEPCCFPETLFTDPDPGGEDRWWVLHVKPRTEKALARKLYSQQVPHFLPTIEQVVRVRGRKQTSYHPLFPGYVFLRSNNEGRIKALSTNYIANCLSVVDQVQLRTQIERVYKVMHTQLPIGLEQHLVPGASVIICRGALAGLEGKIVRKGKKLNFVVEVNMLNQGVWVEIERWMLEPIQLQDLPPEE